ncbi:MAG: ABC transporter permease [Christensenellales bacterium]
MFLVLVVLCVMVTVLSDKFFTASNLLNVARQTSINGILAIGISFVIMTGGIDLSVGSILAFTAAVTCTFIVDGMNPVLATLIGLIIGIAIGLFSGIFVAKLRIAPFIATLATMTIFRGLTLVYTGGMPVTGLDSGFLLIGAGYLGPIPLPVIIMVVVLALAWFVQRKTKFGRYVYAIGGNESAAKLSGIQVDRVKIAVYGISGFLCVISGLITATRIDSAQPLAGDGAELDAIAAVVIGGVSLDGGKGSVIGVVVGALIIGVINNALNLLDVSPYYQKTVKGLVILLAVVIDRLSQRRAEVAK